MKITVQTRQIAILFILFLTGCTDPFSDTHSQVPPDHLKASQSKALQLCAGCHGPTGIGTASFNPNLACQKKEYMVKQLNYYRDGSRTTHRPMSNIAKLLTDEEVEFISEWYSITGCQ